MRDFTVVVPVYNVEKYLPRCIDSILAQACPPKKIILVDDGSTDESGRICDNYAERESTVVAIHQSNQGPSAARNKGIDLVETELITFVDADDYIDVNMYAVLLKNMESANADMSVCGVWIENEDGEKYPRRTTGIRKSFTSQEALIELNSYNYFDESFCNVMFLRELFEGENPLRFPTSESCEDKYLMHKVIDRIKKLVYDSDPYYHYVQRGNSRSRNVVIKLTPMEASITQLKFYREKHPEIAYVAETDCAFSHMGIYSAYVRSGQRCPKKLLRELKIISKKYLRSVLKNPHIPKIKKLQALSFCYALPVYKYVIGRTAHR